MSSLRCRWFLQPISSVLALKYIFDLPVYIGILFSIDYLRFIDYFTEILLTP